MKNSRPRESERLESPDVVANKCAHRLDEALWSQSIAYWDGELRHVEALARDRDAARKPGRDKRGARHFA